MLKQQIDLPYHERQNEVSELLKQKAGVDMLNGSVMKNLIRFSVPLLLTNWLQLLFNTADRFIVSRWVGSDALAAVGATFPFYIMVICLIGGIGAGVSVCAANDGPDDNGLRHPPHFDPFCLLFALFMLPGSGADPGHEITWYPADVVDVLCCTSGSISFACQAPSYTCSVLRT